MPLGDRSDASQVEEVIRRGIHVCVCTSYPAHREPRGPRHAAAIASVPGVSVTFVDAAPYGDNRVSIRALENASGIRWMTFPVPHRRKGKYRMLWNRVMGQVGRIGHAAIGAVSNDSLNSSLRGYQELLESVKADIYVAHNIDTLLPAWRAAKKIGAELVFDSMEFHSDMGDGQSEFEKRLITEIEEGCLKDCAMIMASSPEVADALESRYSLHDILPLYNVPPLIGDESSKLPGFNLYWRNAVIGFGQRGLGDVFGALEKLPEEIHLHLQGRPGMDGGASIQREIESKGLQSRVTIHPPYRPDEAISQAARFQVGLCLEHRCNKNHDLTVSNKMFDYHMAGLAVVSSNLPGLSRVINQSDGGLLYEAGNVDDLASKLRTLYDRPALLVEKSRNARRFAEVSGNLDLEMGRFRDEIVDRVLSRIKSVPK